MCIAKSCRPLLAIDNPSKHNALDLEMWKAFPDIMVALDRDPQVRVIVVRGAGRESFASGADIGEFATLRADAEGGRLYEATNEAAFWAVSAWLSPATCAWRPRAPSSASRPHGSGSAILPEP